MHKNTQSAAKCVHFRKSQKVTNHSTLLGNGHWPLPPRGVAKMPEHGRQTAFPSLCWFGISRSCLLFVNYTGGVSGTPSAQIRSLWISSSDVHLYTVQYTVDTLLEKLADDAIAQLYVTKLQTISLYLSKIYVTQSYALVSSVTYSEICQKNVLTVQGADGIVAIFGRSCNLGAKQVLTPQKVRNFTAKTK